MGAKLTAASAVILKSIIFLEVRNIDQLTLRQQGAACHCGQSEWVIISARASSNARRLGS